MEFLPNIPAEKEFRSSRSQSSKLFIQLEAEAEIKIEQAGAELSQAQVKLEVIVEV